MKEPFKYIKESLESKPSRVRAIIKGINFRKSQKIFAHKDQGRNHLVGKGIIQSYIGEAHQQ